MKNIIKLIVVILTLSVSVACSPKKIADRMQKNISVVAIENVSGSVSGGWVITLRMQNDTGYQPTLQRAELDIYFDNTLTAHASLMAPVTLPKHRTASIDIPVEISIRNSIKALSLLLRLSNKNFDGVEITLDSTVELMGVNKNISFNKLSIKQLIEKL
ncbi:MAG: LEA type 2 family protein [Alistipes sp.]|nr:LEA type 2 family protein [Alistipes sp.]